MPLYDLLAQQGREREEAVRRNTQIPQPRPLLTTPSTFSKPSEQTDNRSAMLTLLASQLGGGGGGGGSYPVNGSMDLMTKRGATLDSEAMQSLLAARRAGYNVFPYIGSSYRDMAQQRSLYQQHLSGAHPGPVAAPGSSMHNYGLAIDVGSMPQRLIDYILANGWYNGANFGDPGHYSYGRLG